MVYKILLLVSMVVLFFGCGGATPASNSAVSSQKIASASVMDIIDEADKEESERSDGKEIYFADTHNRMFYTKSHEGSLGFHVDMLLRSLFENARGKLPHTSRRKKLNVAVEADDKKLREAAQDFIVSSRKYNLSNSDAETMRVLKKVLRHERDGLYRGRSKVTSKEKSDVVLYLSGGKKSGQMKISAKLIAKNGTILGRKTVSFTVNPAKSNQEWVEVQVPRNDGPPQAYEIMRNPVTQKEYFGSGANVSVGDVSFSEANHFCQKVMKAELVSPYVFENARRALVISRPTSPINSEMIAPYDEEEDDIYYMDGDNVESPDGTIILFDWNSEKYFAVSNIYRSKKTTFRCMRVK